MSKATGMSQPQAALWKELGEPKPHGGVPWISEFQADLVRGATGQQKARSIWDLSSQQAYQLGLEHGELKAKSERKVRADHEVQRVLTEQRQQHEQGFQSAFAEFRTQLDGHEQTLAQRLLALAVSLARATVRQHIEIDAEAALPIVQEALKHLLPSASPTHIFVNPEDEPIVRQALEAELAEGSVMLLGEPGLERTDVRMTSEFSELDHRLQARWNQTLIQAGIHLHAEEPR